MPLTSCRIYGIRCNCLKYFINSVLTNACYCTFQCVLLGVPHHNVLQGVQSAAQQRNAQIVEMASTKRRTRLAQVNGDMSLIVCVYDD